MKQSHTVILVAILGFFSMLTVSCKTLEVAIAPVGVFSTTETKVGIATSKGDLLLSNLRLSPWQNRIPDCEKCTVSVERTDRPSGPSWVVTIKEDDQIVWAFIDSRKRKIASELGVFSVLEQNLSLTKPDKTVEVALNGVRKIDSCSLAFLWKSDELATSQVNLSNENPEVHYQALYSCQ